jgi:hypothetical protein
LVAVLSMAACSSNTSVTTTPTTIAKPESVRVESPPGIITPLAAATTVIPKSPATIVTVNRTPSRIPPNTQTIKIAPSISVKPSSTPAATSSRAILCPNPQINIVPTMIYDKSDPIFLGMDEQYLLEYLNDFGVDALISADRNSHNIFGHSTKYVLAYRDLTDDGVADLVYSYGSLYIFGCDDGKYRTLLSVPANYHGRMISLITVKDINKNGMPELLLDIDQDTAGDRYTELFEWDGKEFNSLFSSNDEWADNLVITHNSGVFGFQDLDKDGMMEYVLHDSIPIGSDWIEFQPWRKQTNYYKWNGSKFAFYRKMFSSPEYRFQAIQDADLAASYQNYEQAQELYQQAIFSDTLEWWSPERRDYIRNLWYSQYSEMPLTTMIPPGPDPAEMDYLAAYARYRIMLLHVVRGWKSDALVVYNTLQEKFPENSNGHIYAQMAHAFWADYVSSGNIGQACGKAIELAMLNEEEATRYIGSNYHGWQSLQYQPKDLCPFK